MKSKWIIVDGDYDSIDICEQNGDFICSVHGDTLGQVIDRAEMISSAPELYEAWHLLNVLSANMMDDGPTWPRVLEWLERNKSFRPKSDSEP